MFFFSRTDGARHSFWGKLKNAGLVKAAKGKTRQEEAEDRRTMILDGSTSEKYLVGLTTFYSFPTPASDKSELSGVAGVEKIFKPCIDKIAEMEVERILSYPFTNDAIIVITQKSANCRFSEITKAKPIYWPIRGKGSGGEVLANQLQNARRALT